MPVSPTKLFDPISGDLFPTYREEYVQGQLSPELLPLVEAYLKNSPIQANIVLGRAQALLAAAQTEERAFAPPPWVQEQLRYQPTASGAGPLRRPVVRLVLGLFLLFIGASVVQWLRNEPLVPAPIAQMVTQAASSATQAAHHLVQRLAARSRPASVVEVPVISSKPVKRPLPSKVSRSAEPVHRQTLITQIAVVAAQPADSLANTEPVSSALPVAAVNIPSTVRGRITDNWGRPLPGATVFIQGTKKATSTNAEGAYELTAPLGSSLLFSYGGYLDQVQRYAGAGTLNVILMQSSPAGQSRRK